MRRRIAVFGSSEPGPGEPLYETARELGRLLAEADFDVLTGGYGGVMEGASRGAREAGAGAVGVTCSIFAGRAPNAWLTEVVPTADLYERTRELIQRAGGFVVLAGRAGTLAELSLLWALHRAGCHPPTPVLLLGDPWPALLSTLSRESLLDPEQLDATRLVRSPAEAVGWLRAGERR